MEARAERSFSPTPDSVAEARRFVIETLGDVPADISVIELLTGELAANAVLHAHSEYRVRVFTNSNLVRVEIVNDEPELLLSLKEPSSEGGRGLRILDALAQDWGTVSHQDEKIVWFAVSTAGADGASVDA